jgi:hypothetical protein
MTHQESDGNANHMNADGCSSVTSLDNNATWSSAQQLQKGNPASIDLQPATPKDAGAAPRRSQDEAPSTTHDSTAQFPGPANTRAFRAGALRVPTPDSSERTAAERVA